jgi:MFS family permease
VIARLLAYAGTFRGFEPDARRLLVASIVLGAAGSLWWIDFNLYLAALGLSRATIGLVAAVASVSSAVVALPASAASDRVGRRFVMLGAVAVMVVALGALLLTQALAAIFLAAAVYAAGSQALGVVVAPFLTEHSRPDHRSELFALQFAIQSGTSVGAVILGGVVAQAVATAGGLDPGGPATYRVILVLMAIFLVGGLAIIVRLTDDRPAPAGRRLAFEAGEPAPFPRNVRDPRRVAAGRFGITIRDRARFARLLLPGFLIAIGAGQVIPFLNLFIQRKFGLDLASLNAAFALTSLGTVLAILLQPAIAKRLGRLPSVVAVQAASLPFLVVLGFSPLLWTVVIAMAVRNSLMNAGNPIFIAFALDHVTPAERATYSAASSLLWSVGWAIAAPWYSLLQATLGFDAGYAVNFMTIIVLYTLGTGLLWLWFHDAEPRPGRILAAAAGGSPSA